MLALDFVTYSFETGQDLLINRSQAERKQHGQFLTPVAVARFMAKQEANRQSLRIHDILLGIKDRYDREYAENTRETIRRQVIHQFEQAGLVVRNPDDPTLATNSPRTHYSLSEAAIRVIRT